MDDVIAPAPTTSWRLCQLGAVYFEISSSRVLGKVTVGPCGTYRAEVDGATVSEFMSEMRAKRAVEAAFSGQALAVGA